MNLFLLVFFIFSLKISEIICTSKCEDFVTCSTCVFDSSNDCVWCSEEKHNGKRCQPRNLTKEAWCKDSTSKPKIERVFKQNADFSAGENGKNIVQLKPQKASVILASPGASVDIPIFYQPAKDAPLDIYFIIDNSNSIVKESQKIVSQTNILFEELKNYTNNINVGVGTYIEKPALPYGNPDMQKIYTFKNHLSLINDSDKFMNTLKSLKPGSNYDTPEDLLDALIQTMLCQKKINWRKDSRRIIIVFTNAFYHSAGDGKIIGAFKRHNMECSTNDDLDTTMDYPSIAQLNRVAKDNGFIIIFAYLEDKNDKNQVGDYYKLLSEKIYGAKREKLEFENIAQIIKDEYIKIIEDVQIESEHSSDIEVTITKKCSVCKAMHSNALEFVATIKVILCDPSKDKEIINITPMSMNEALQIEIEFECQCQCEKDNSKENNSTKCSGEGDYQCGICKCKPDRYGDDCSCKSDSMNPTNDFENCRKNANDILLCSGHGECSCGKCESCHKGFSGAFCEYDENACPQPEGILCSGHGKCTMGSCQCDPNWGHSLSGIEDCGCDLQPKSCIAPHSNKVCSGNGKCVCGKCVCADTENSSDICTGRYCDKCSWFTAKRCEELEDYAYCRFLNQTTCLENYNLTDTSVVFANRSEINSPDNTEWYMANLCRVKKGDDESIFVFKFYYTLNTNEGTRNDTMLNLVIQKELDEKPPANIWVVVGSAIGGIVLIGLLSLLLWKIIMDIYDEREYNQFVEKAKAAGYDVNMTENPWYEPPTTTFINPAHEIAQTALRRRGEGNPSSSSC